MSLIRASEHTVCQKMASPRKMEPLHCICTWPQRFAAYKVPQDRHLDYNFPVSLNLFTIKMPFVMRILAMHTNGRLTAWHGHLITKVHFQLWTIAYPSQQERVVYMAQRDRVFTGTTECSSRLLTSHYRARNGRVMRCCLLRTAYNGVHTISYCRQIALLTQVL